MSNIKSSMKMFAFDMDGTILNSKGQINQSTIEALTIAKSYGHKIVLASGRPYFNMVDFAKKNEGLFDFFVCNNGAYFYDVKEHKFFFEDEVPKSVVNRFIELGTTFGAFFAVHTNEGVYRSRLTDTVSPWSNAVIEEEWYKFDLTPIEEVLMNIKSQKIMQLSYRANKEIIEECRDSLQCEIGNIVDLHVAGEVYLDVNPLNTSKLTGLQKLCEHIGMSIEDVVAFGDSGNDMQMVEGAGLGVAMGNATQELKKVAKLIIGDNNSDAIRDTIIKLIKE